MTKVFLTMAMSLDGFIAGPDDDAQNPAGTDGMRLMDWLGTNDDGEATADGPGTSPAIGAATTTTACRSSSPRTRLRPRTPSSGSTTSPTASSRASGRPRRPPAVAT